ncbi:MAG: iron-sulfur cluster assembly protein IscA [Gammaproteobacteria bacterium]|nr:iron-sulfur cluster assembly protein IscA [Gammaproteobacteria bacterium]
MGVNLTQVAAEHVNEYLSKRGGGLGIRLMIRTTGCSGLTYVLEPVDTVQPEDQVFSSHGVDVYVDPKSLMYVDGTEMDYVKKGVNEGFEFHNPNVQGECGCGESFTV